VMTLAQAAASTAGASGGGTGAGAGAGAGGAGGGAGGGISAATVGIVGGAAAGTIVAAKELLAGTTYKSQFSGTLPMAFPGSPPCIRNENQTGEIGMELKDDNGTITGSAHVHGTIAMVLGPCSPSTSDSFGSGTITVNATAANLSFTATASNRFSGGSGGSGTNAYAFSFAGALANGQITGTLIITRTITDDLFPGLPGTGTVSYDVVLR
jgi:hypothetical protein